MKMRGILIIHPVMYFLCTRHFEGEMLNDVPVQSVCRSKEREK